LGRDDLNSSCEFAMSFRFLIVDTYYNQFWRSFYRQHRGLKSRTYQEQHKALMNQCFGTSNFYSSNLYKLGHEAEDVVANCEPLQFQWAVENGLSLLSLISVRSKLWLLKVLEAQIEKTRPDILYILNVGFIDGSLLREMRRKVGLIVGQVACPLVPGIDFNAYDLILSCLPSYVDMFIGMGIPSQYFRFGFEPTVLERLGQTKSSFSAVFIGSYDGSHHSGNQLLEQIAREAPVDFWGFGVESLTPESPIRYHYNGEAWGIDMYRILAQSKIAINRHVDIAGRYAANVRLFEATGVGTLLVTDDKDNLNQLFKVGQEVVSCSSPKQCIEQVKYYLEHENERLAIARAGQQHTLREHTYQHRMEELVEIIQRYLNHRHRLARNIVMSQSALSAEPQIGKPRSLFARFGLLVINQIMSLRQLVAEPIWRIVYQWQRIIGKLRIRGTNPYN
jgi:spore maturation protein CgeB